jgi:hypothetical protein
MVDFPMSVLAELSNETIPAKTGAEAEVPPTTSKDMFATMK